MNKFIYIHAMICVRGFFSLIENKKNKIGMLWLITPK